MGTNGDYLGLNFMGTTGKTIDVIPQVSKSSHYLPPPPHELMTNHGPLLYHFQDSPFFSRSYRLGSSIEIFTRTESVEIKELIK